MAPVFKKEKKMAKQKIKLAIIIMCLIIISTLFSGCGMSKPDLSGIILQIDGDKVLIASKLDEDLYKDLSHMSVEKILSDEMANKILFLGLIYLNYKDLNKFAKGDYVDVWIDGQILDSYPQQASAKKIVLK